MLVSVYYVVYFLRVLVDSKDKKLSYRKETVRLHDITSNSAVAEKKHSRVGQF